MNVIKIKQMKQRKTQGNLGKANGTNRNSEKPAEVSEGMKICFLNFSPIRWKQKTILFILKIGGYVKFIVDYLS
jgi:hypothetical protein